MNIGFDENTAVEEYIIDIRDKNQVIKHRYALNSKDIEKNILMSEHYIQLEEFSLDSFIKFVRTDYIIWKGEKYMLKEDYIPDEINKLSYKYTLRFDHWTTFLQDDIFYYMNQGLEEAEWSLTSNAANFFQLLVDNANRYFGVNTFNVGTIEFTDIKFLTFSKVSIWAAATQIAEAYGGEWYLTGTTFHLVKKFSYGSEIDFQAEVSVEKMDRSEGENSEKYSRILAFGSTRNIPANYRETTPDEAVDAIYQKRLRIPASKGKFIDAFPIESPEEVKAQVIVFEDVYPKRIGTMSSISTVEYTDTDTDTGEVTRWNAYRYKDTGLQFKKEYELPGVELRIAIQSGNLNGLDFAIKFNPLGRPETDPDSQLFEIVRNEDYGKALPNDILKPQNGDTYILYGFNIQLVSDQYVPAGEEELFDTATEWLTDNNKDKSVFECPTMIQYFEDHEMDLEIGQKVKLIHVQFEGGFRSSRIQGYEKHLLDKYQATYTVGDNAAYSWPKEVNESIKELQIAGITYQATGRNGVYLITQFDNTPASDFNVYSAKASNARYLNKQTGGTVQGDVTFQKKVKAKEVISDQFGNETFASGQFGSGFRSWLAANGQSYAEFDNLMVRREMIINTLTIAEIKSVGGQILLSLANMYCNGVTDGGTYYKCTFDTANGTITNQFAVDDQVICRKFNGVNIKYYWARVTSIGADYINISKTDKDGSSIPAIGDEIIQFGNRTNAARQSAILLSAYGADAPSIKQYAGINSYNLTGKEVTVISPSGNKFTGDFVIQSSGTNVTTAIDNAKNTAISTAATDATNKVDAIGVGGRNLMRLSKLTGTQTEGKYNDGTGRYITASSGSNWRFQNFTQYEQGKYSVSFWMKSDNAGKVIFDICDQNTRELDITTNWRLYKIENVTVTNFLVNPYYGFIDFYVDPGSLVIGGKLYISGMMVEYATKSATYSPAPEDVQSNIDAAQNVAQNAATAASNADAKATTANNLLSDIASDNRLTPNEKSSVRQEWNVIAAELSVNNTQADTFGITTEKTAYNSAFQALANYLNNGTAWSTGVPSWISDANLSVTTTIVGNTFRANWKAYYDARTILFNAIAKKSKQLADAAQSSADTANAGLLTKVAYSEYNAQMQILNNQISAKVSQTDFNVLGQRVNDTESNITQQAGQISSVVTKANTAQTTADDAATAASNANTNAQNAQTTANSKNRTYYQDAQPSVPSGGFSVGDIWQKVTLTDISGNINSDSSKNVCRLEYRWNGTTWVQINVNVSGSYVTQTNDSITSLVTKTGINGLGAGETLKSLIDQTPSQIQLVVSAIQIGQRNLIRDSIYSGSVMGYKRTNGKILLQASGNRVVLTESPLKTAGYFALSFWMKVDNFASSFSLYPNINDRTVITIPISANTGWEFYSGSVYVSSYIGQYGFIDFENVPTGAATVTISDVVIVRGNKPLQEWTPAPEDVQARIDIANTAAQNAAIAASNADVKATTANNLLTDIASDNKLDPAEKQNTKKEWDILVSEYSKNISQANSFSVSTTAYTTAYNALSSYITPLLTNLTTTSDIVGTTFRSTFKAYYDARTDLLNAVSTKAKTIADSKTDLDTVKAGITINTDGITAFGNQFKVDSTLIANAIQTQELNVGNGNFNVGTDGKIKAKGAEIEGKLRLLWNGSSSGEADTITVVDASQSPEKTKVLITPMNIRSINDIAGNQYNVQVIAGGASASDSTTDSQKTWTGQSFTLASGKKYDLVIPAITLIGETNVEYDRTTSSSMYRMYLDNTTTGSSLLIAYGNTSKTNLNAQWNSAYVASGRQEGTYRLRIVIEASSDAFGNSTASYSVPAGAIIVVRPITDAIEIGGNGMMGAFTNERYFHISTNGMYFRMGDKGFRITTSGVQVSDNMQMQSPTWRTL